MARSPIGDEAGVARSRFATTRWSLVMEAGGDSAAAAEALSSLCATYWYPVFAFVRRQGHPADEAQDLTQGFFARVIEKGYFADADRTRGRFRTFLLTACQRFLANERDRALALKRGGGSESVSIDAAFAERRYARALATGETPERLYDRQWCLTLLASVFDDLRSAYAASGKSGIYDRLSPFLNMPDDAGTRADAARDLGMTATAVDVAIHRLRLRYRDALRRRVEETVTSPEEVEDELRHLLRTVSKV